MSNQRNGLSIQKTWDTDVLIIGSGAAGLRAALAASDASAGRDVTVTLMTKSVLKESNSQYAQGGIAVAMNVDDTVALHVKDTCAAGDGLCELGAVETMVSEGIPRVTELVEWGANFDWEGTLPRFTREAAHSRKRIVHKGDATGRETTDVLIQRVQMTERIAVLANAFAIDFLTVDGNCYGVIAAVENELVCIRAKATIMATGGLGRLYPCTSNPQVATGDGFAAAWRAGCELIDMEFVQFHPTTLYLDGAPNFLISEAVRGEGGRLINIRGERFMEKYHEMGELAPRDVVSRAIHAEMRLTGFSCVYLDITHKPGDFILERFPTISETTQHHGLDIRVDLIPVRPAAHFMMGGIRTNLDAETNVQGLYACGEVACTGVHGANRLASNSLLECLVFGARAGVNAAEFASSEQDVHLPYVDESSSIREIRGCNNGEITKAAIRETLWKNVAIERNSEGLQETLAELEELTKACSQHTMDSPQVAFGVISSDIARCETLNMLDTAYLITEASLIRTESRGAHYRTDFPDRDDSAWQRRLILTRGEEPQLIELDDSPSPE